MNDIAENQKPTAKSLYARIITFQEGQVWQFHPDLRLVVERVRPESSMLVVRVDRAGTVAGVYERPYGIMTSDVLRFNAWLVNP